MVPVAHAAPARGDPPWRPWEQSTGPRTPEGKASAAIESLWLDTAEQREFMRGVRSFLRKQRQVLKRL